MQIDKIFSFEKFKPLPNLFKKKEEKKNYNMILKFIFFMVIFFKMN